MRAVLGIGTNMGDRFKNLQHAVDSISLLPNTKVLNVSPIYETEPWGYTEQQTFYNGVVLIDTQLSPNALLGACLGVEAALGRVRLFKNGPRIIDIDVLLYENVNIESDELNIPHPFIKERDFVLVPLNDIFKNDEAFGFNFHDEYEKTDKNKLAKINSSIKY